MVAGTLYTYPDSFRGLKAQIAARFSNSNVKVVEVKSNDQSHAKVPSFQSDDKKVNLFESNAIAYYVANEQLRGGNDRDRAEVLQWLEYGNNEVTPSTASWVYPALSLIEFNKQSVERAKEEVKRILNFLNDHLKTRTYLVGERITLADIAVACDLMLAYQHVFDAQFRNAYVNTNRWFTTIINQPQVTAVLKGYSLCEKAAEFCPQKLAENRSKGGAAEGGKKDKSAKKEEKKKEAKKEAKPAKKEAPPADDEPEEDEYQEPKTKDPFADMPKGTFNMDEFKRTYSNEELTVSLPYLWKNFDKEHYSFWYCEYKYSDELKLTFMTSNLIGGMFQRIEKLRKNAFASMCVWGENNNNTIAGVWFWKGHELAFPLCPDWTTDYESYEWRKMNPDDENERKLINQVFSWEGDIKGRKFADGKIFK